MYKLFIKRGVKSHELLDEILSDLDIDNTLKYNEYGKPYLVNSSLFFNLSDCNDVVVCVISDNEVGVDVQQKTFRKRLINRICNEEEKKVVLDADSFTRMWTNKESYVKCIGQGLSYGMNNVDTTKLSFINKIVFDDYYISIYEMSGSNEK